MKVHQRTVLASPVRLMLQPTWNEIALAPLGAVGRHPQAGGQLSAAQLVSGASRLVAAALQRVRLAFGIVGASWLGTQADKHQTEPESNRPDGP